MSKVASVPFFFKFKRRSNAMNSSQSLLCSCLDITYRLAPTWDDIPCQYNETEIKFWKTFEWFLDQWKTKKLTAIRFEIIVFFHFCFCFVQQHYERSKIGKIPEPFFWQPEWNISETHASYFAIRSSCFLICKQTKEISITKENVFVK